MKRHTFIIAVALVCGLMFGLFSLLQTPLASGIFTVRGKLKGFTEELYFIETKSLVYEIRKSGLNAEQLQELKKKKTGHDVELVVATESVARVRDQ